MLIFLTSINSVLAASGSTQCQFLFRSTEIGSEESYDDSTLRKMAKLIFFTDREFFENKDKIFEQPYAFTERA